MNDLADLGAGVVAGLGHVGEAVEQAEHGGRVGGGNEQSVLSGAVLSREHVARTGRLGRAHVGGDAQPPFASVSINRAERLPRSRRGSLGRGHRGVLDHIRKELVEIEAEPGDVTEWADLIILAFDGAWRSGHAPADTIAAIKAKQEQNEAREWPDWRTADPNKAIEHIHALDATPETGCES